MTGISFVDEPELLLVHCLVSLNDINKAYYYKAIGTATSVMCYRQAADDNLPLLWILQCEKKLFSNYTFHAFVEGLNIWIDITRYKKPVSPICSLLVRIGQGSYPSKPLHQVKDQLQPPNHQLSK
jgi:hypothetical protein